MSQQNGTIRGVNIVATDCVNPYSPNPTNKQVTYQASNSVTLNPGFYTAPGATFTLNNLPQGATFSWSQSTSLGLKSTSGNTVTYSIGSGPGNVYAIINLTTIGTSYTINYPVWGGAPFGSNISGPKSRCIFFL